MTDPARTFALKRTHFTFAAIVITSAFIAFAGGRQTAPKALGGQFDNVGLVQVKGTIKYVELFCNYDKADDQCKFIVATEVGEAIQVGNGPMVLDIPAQGDAQALDVPDSRMNLFVDQDSKHCTGDPAGVEVCTYKIKSDMANIVYVYKEEVGSTGLPEYIGTPK